MRAYKIQVNTQTHTHMKKTCCAIAKQQSINLFIVCYIKFVSHSKWSINLIIEYLWNGLFGACRQFKEKWRERESEGENQYKYVDKFYNFNKRKSHSLLSNLLVCEQHNAVSISPVQSTTQNYYSIMHLKTYVWNVRANEWKGK